MAGIWCIWGCCGSPMVVKNLVSSLALSFGEFLLGLWLVVVLSGLSFSLCG